MAGFVGESIPAEKQQEGEGKQEDQVLIYTHKSFDINYNNEQVSHRSLPLLYSPRAESGNVELRGIFAPAHREKLPLSNILSTGAGLSFCCLLSA